MAREAERHETVIIGGGQAGLATAYHLTRRHASCVILDAGDRVGDAWRQRWPTLRLYTPARFDGLPGMRFPGPRNAFPSAHEMGDYLEAYAARFELPVRSGVRVERVVGDGERFVVHAGGRRLEADNVVVATGVMQVPVTPDFAADLDPRIRQLHSSEYQSPTQLQEGAVLVVGASHSGGDIAYELVRKHRVVLSGRDTGEIPFSVESRSRTVGVQDGLPVLDGGRVLDVANVIWCTGFRHDYSWLELPLDRDDGYPRQSRGVVASVPGLYFIGMLFLHSFSSMLILGAGRDAKVVAKHIVSWSRRRAPVPAESLRTSTMSEEHVTS